jgi:DNA-directed RNA polymerase specialized sigma24 family protein
MVNLDNLSIALIKDAVSRAIAGVGKHTNAAGREMLQAYLDDITQDTFVKVLTFYDESKASQAIAKQNQLVKDHAKYGINMGYKWSEGSPIAAFSFIIGKNIAIEMLRGKGRYKRCESLDNNLGDNENPRSLADILPTSEASAYERLARLERDQWLLEEIESLPAKQREALLTVCQDEEPKLNGAHRVNKFRAIEKITSNLPKSLRTQSVRSKNYGRKRVAA